MNLKVQLNEARAKLTEAETENRQLRAVIERAGLTLLEGSFTLRDGTIVPFYLDGPGVKDDREPLVIPWDGVYEYP